MINQLPEEEYFARGHRACAGCGSALAIRHVLKAAGKNTIIAQATGCMEVVSTPYPETAWKLPWIHVLFENAAAAASGIEVALKKLNKKDINVLAIGGDGGTFDIGLQALSGAIERGHKFCYVCIDNEAYANTGVQRSGATPMFASTTTTPAGKAIPGKQQPKKPLPFIIAAHGIRYVATSSSANPVDIYNKVKKALSINGPSFVQVFTPCPTGWKFPNEQTIDIAKIAIKTGATLIYEIEDGILKLNKVEDRKPVEEYLKLQGRFKHLTNEHIKQIQKYVDERYKFLSENDGKKLFDVLY